MDTENIEGKKGGMGKTITVIIILVVLAVAGYFAIGGNKIKSLTGNEPESVATVNGTVIPKSEFDTQLAATIASYSAQGITATTSEQMSQLKKIVIDNLINNEILAQEVKAAGITAKPEEVEQQYQAIVTQSGGADKLKEELVKNNITDAKLHENIAKQLEAKEYLLKNIDISTAAATDAEVAQFYTDYSKAQKIAGIKTIPTLKELSDQIKQKIILDKQNALATNFIATLRAKATVVISPSVQ
ncbi:MAG: SurA N-terminal domain-containing protein [Patescibacteria group bacterium]